MSSLVVIIAIASEGFDDNKDNQGEYMVLLVVVYCSFVNSLYLTRQFPVKLKQTKMPQRLR